MRTGRQPGAPRDVRGTQTRLCRLLKWDVPVLAVRSVIDQFDDPRATYVILANGRDDHLASARLLETNRLHILGTLLTSFALAPRQPAQKGPPR
jgi:acyl-homoserine lactone synthase